MQNMWRDYWERYPKLLAHITAHYSASELLYNEEIEENIIFINFESSKTSNEMFDGHDYDYALRCKSVEIALPLKKKR